jgi:hypothetical protein
MTIAATWRYADFMSPGATIARKIEVTHAREPSASRAELYSQHFAHRTVPEPRFTKENGPTKMSEVRPPADINVGERSATQHQEETNATRTKEPREDT